MFPRITLCHFIPRAVVIWMINSPTYNQTFIFFSTACKEFVQQVFATRSSEMLPRSDIEKQFERACDSTSLSRNSPGTAAGRGDAGEPWSASLSTTAAWPSGWRRQSPNAENFLGMPLRADQCVQQSREIGEGEGALTHLWLKASRSFHFVIFVVNCHIMSPLGLRSRTCRM